MSRRKPSRKQMLRFCDELGPEDGQDPRLEPKEFSDKVSNRKALQLCAQVRRTLSSLLSGECNDELLRDLFVESIIPAPHSGRLLVTVCPTALGTETDSAQILQRLHLAAPFLRREVASAIHRRKTPDLVFRVEERDLGKEDGKTK